MTRSAKPIIILVAEDDADDRMLLQDAFDESRLSNELRFVEDGEQLIAYLSARDGRQPAILPFFCMVDQRRSLHRETCKVSKDGSSGFLSHRVPHSSLVEQMGTRRSPLATYAPASPAARAYSGLWREISDRSTSLPAQSTE